MPVEESDMVLAGNPDPLHALPCRCVCWGYVAMSVGAQAAAKMLWGKVRETFELVRWCFT
jgi:hypothetical protein